MNNHRCFLRMINKDLRFWFLIFAYIVNLCSVENNSNKIYDYPKLIENQNNDFEKKNIKINQKDNNKIYSPKREPENIKDVQRKTIVKNSNTNSLFLDIEKRINEFKDFIFESKYMEKSFLIFVNRVCERIYENITKLHENLEKERNLVEINILQKIKYVAGLYIAYIHELKPKNVPFDQNDFIDKQILIVYEFVKKVISEIAENKETLIKGTGCEKTSTKSNIQNYVNNFYFNFQINLTEDNQKKIRAFREEIFKKDTKNHNSLLKNLEHKYYSIIINSLENYEIDNEFKENIFCNIKIDVADNIKSSKQYYMISQKIQSDILYRISIDDIEYYQKTCEPYEIEYQNKLQNLTLYYDSDLRFIAQENTFKGIKKQRNISNVTHLDQQHQIQTNNKKLKHKGEYTIIEMEKTKNKICFNIKSIDIVIQQTPNDMKNNENTFNEIQKKNLIFLDLLICCKKLCDQILLDQQSMSDPKSVLYKRFEELLLKLKSSIPILPEKFIYLLCYEFHTYKFRKNINSIFTIEKNDENVKNEIVKFMIELLRDHAGIDINPIKYFHENEVILQKIVNLLVDHIDKINKIDSFLKKIILKMSELPFRTNFYIEIRENICKIFSCCIKIFENITNIIQQKSNYNKKDEFYLIINYKKFSISVSMLKIIGILVEKNVSNIENFQSEIKEFKNCINKIPLLEKSPNSLNYKKNQSILYLEYLYTRDILNLFDFFQEKKTKIDFDRFDCIYLIKYCLIDLLYQNIIRMDRITVENIQNQSFKSEYILIYFKLHVDFIENLDLFYNFCSQSKMKTIHYAIFVSLLPAKLTDYQNSFVIIQKIIYLHLEQAYENKNLSEFFSLTNQIHRLNNMYNCKHKFFSVFYIDVKLLHKKFTKIVELEKNKIANIKRFTKIAKTKLKEKDQRSNTSVLSTSSSLELLLGEDEIFHVYLKLLKLSDLKKTNFSKKWRKKLFTISLILINHFYYKSKITYLEFFSVEQHNKKYSNNVFDLAEDDSCREIGTLKILFSILPVEYKVLFISKFYKYFLEIIIKIENEICKSCKNYMKDHNRSFTFQGSIFNNFLTAEDPNKVEHMTFVFDYIIFLSKANDILFYMNNENQKNLEKLEIYIFCYITMYENINIIVKLINNKYNTFMFCILFILINKVCDKTLILLRTSYDDYMRTNPEIFVNDASSDSQHKIFLIYVENLRSSVNLEIFDHLQNELSYETLFFELGKFVKILKREIMFIKKIKYFQLNKDLINFAKLMKTKFTYCNLRTYENVFVKPIKETSSSKSRYEKDTHKAFNDTSYKNELHDYENICLFLFIELSRNYSE